MLMKNVIQSLVKSMSILLGLMAASAADVKIYKKNSRFWDFWFKHHNTDAIKRRNGYCNENSSVA